MLVTTGSSIRDIRQIKVPSVSSGALIAALLVLNNRVPGSLDYIVRVAALINAGYDIEILSENPFAAKQVVQDYYAHLCVIDAAINKEGKL